MPGSKATSLGIRLIDYDGMWVPALAGKKSGEVGHPAYQHPQRLREGTYSVEVDRFPHLVIYTALRALMVRSRYLWNKYDNGDNLLFRQADLDAPGNSALFHELRQVNDPEVQKLVGTLSQAAQKPLEQTPLLDELIPDAKVGRKSVPAQQAPTSESIFASATSNRQRKAKRKSHAWAWAAGAVAVAAVVGGVLLFGGNRGPRTTKPEVAVAQGNTNKQIPPATKAESKTPPRPEPQPATTPQPKPEPEPKAPDPKPEPKPDPTPEPAEGTTIVFKTLKDIKALVWRRRTPMTGRFGKEN